nr:DUF512 domain-containing protein [Desulfobacterales bacterium]
MIVTEVKSGSIAERVGISPGDNIEMINGEPLRDIIDYRYLVGDGVLEVTVNRDGTCFRLRIEKPEDEDLGLNFEELEIQRCNNRCIFCFIDQLPPNMRGSLYVKDEDYRLSFLHGTYITLTRLSDVDMKRIIQQRLSPLYISVHSTEPHLRSRMLRNSSAGDILEKIASLASGGIEMHCQVVLCPGINDGKYLERTVSDLINFYPQVRSVSIVPVGLTKYRDHLPPLVPVDRKIAKELVISVHHWQRSFKRQFGTRFVYLADEIYLLAGARFPATLAYEGFPQLENGVGMVRSFLDTFKDRLWDLPRRIQHPRAFILVTGTLASGFMKEVLAQLNRVGNLMVDLVVVENSFFGKTVTVSGLLTGGDIVRSLKHVFHTKEDLTGKSLGGFQGAREEISSSKATGQLPERTLLLPPNCVNPDGLLLDDMTVDEVGERLGLNVKVSDYDLVKSVLSE